MNSIDDIKNNYDYWLSLYALDYLKNDLRKAEAYELINKVDESWKRVSNDYIDFRLNRSQYFESEGRKVIREVYKVLGYNPNRGKNDNGTKETKTR